MPKVPYPYEVNAKLVTGNGLFLIEPFPIANQSCMPVVPTCDWNQMSALDIIQNLSLKTKVLFCL